MRIASFLLRVFLCTTGSSACTLLTVAVFPAPTATLSASRHRRSPGTGIRISQQEVTLITDRARSHSSRLHHFLCGHIGVWRIYWKGKRKKRIVPEPGSKRAIRRQSMICFPIRRPPRHRRIKLDGGSWFALYLSWSCIRACSRSWLWRRVDTRETQPSTDLAHYWDRCQVLVHSQGSQQFPPTVLRLFGGRKVAVSRFEL